MARTARIVIPGAWYHVTARGIERRDIFKDDRDRLHFLELLEELTERFRLRIHAYVLMGNHYHLLLQLPESNLSRAVQWLNLSHTAWFNRRHRRAGYLFQGRFKSIIVDPQGWAVALSSYIHLNPVRVAGLRLSKTDVARGRRGRVEDPGAELVRRRLAILRSYRWSSYSAYIKGRAPRWLDAQSVLALAGGAAARRPMHYRDYVENQLREGNVASPWEQLHERMILGAGDFLDRLRKNQSAAGPKTPRWARTPATLQQVIAAVEQARGARWMDFRDRHGDCGRDMLLAMARRTTSLKLAELAKEVGLRGPAQAAMAIKRYEARLAGRVEERRLVNATAKMLGFNYPLANDK